MNGSARANFNLSGINEDRFNNVIQYPAFIKLGEIKLELAYTAAAGVFANTLHVTVVSLEGYESNGHAILFKRTPYDDKMTEAEKAARRDEMFRIQRDFEKKAMAAIAKTLREKEELVIGKVMVNPVAVNDGGRQKVLVPLSMEAFLNTVRKYPSNFGLEFARNIDRD